MGDTPANPDPDTSADPVEPVAQVTEPPVTTNEPPTETPRKYANKYETPDDLETAYIEAQKLISQQGAKIKAHETPALPPDKQVLLDQLKELGVVTQDDMYQNNAISSQKQKDDKEIAELDLTSEQESVLRGNASLKSNLSKTMTECWNDLNSAMGGTVVKRTTTIKPKTGAQDTFVPKPNEEVARLPKEEYDKYWTEYAAWKAGK